MNAKIINVANFKETLSFNKHRYRELFQTSWFFFEFSMHCKAVTSNWRRLIICTYSDHTKWFCTGYYICVWPSWHVCWMWELHQGCARSCIQWCPHTWCILLRLLVNCRQRWKCIETLLTTATGKGGGVRCCYGCWGVDCMCSHHYQPCLIKGCRFTNRSGNEALELFHQMQQDGVDHPWLGC